MNILLVTGKKHLRNLIFLLLLTALVPGLISAQSRGVIDSGSTDAGSLQPGPTTEGVRPEEPEVELPTVVLEYTAIQREELEIILPDEDLIALPELEQQLPDAGSLRVESPSFELGLPKQPQRCK